MKTLAIVLITLVGLQLVDASESMTFSRRLELAYEKLVIETQDDYHLDLEFYPLSKNLSTYLQHLEYDKEGILKRSYEKHLSRGNTLIARIENELFRHEHRPFFCQRLKEVYELGKEFFFNDRNELMASDYCRQQARKLLAPLRKLKSNQNVHVYTLQGNEWGDWIEVNVMIEDPEERTYVALRFDIIHEI